jgi:hypothetical protein
MQESAFVKKLLEQIKRQSEEIALLKKQVSMMSRYISVLEEKLQRYDHPKNRSNSSTPPSQDPFRLKKTRSLREKSGKKHGGQTGPEGHTLTFSEKPDAEIRHKSDYCSACGCDLSDVEAVFAGRRQVIDIPPVVPMRTLLDGGLSAGGARQCLLRQEFVGINRLSSFPPIRSLRADA